MYKQHIVWHWYHHSFRDHPIYSARLHIVQQFLKNYYCPRNASANDSLKIKIFLDVKFKNNSCMVQAIHKISI